MTALFDPKGESAGYSAFSPGVPRINAPAPIEVKRDEQGIEIDPLYSAHIVEYHFVDSVRRANKHRTPGAAKEPARHDGEVE